MRDDRKPTRPAKVEEIGTAKLPPPRSTGALRYLEPRGIQISRRGESPVYLRIYEDKTYTFGRDSDMSVVFRDDSVTRIHGKLSCRTDGRWVYRDLGSRNGSFLSEYPLNAPDEPLERIKIGSDTVVSVGHSVLLANAGRITFVLELPSEQTFVGKIGTKSPVTERLNMAVLEASLNRLPVFLLGQTGSGKSYLARKVHELSELGGAFSSVNCAALPDNADAIRSELLGHVKGAFTGASEERLGKIPYANDGTLFLDEVESMPVEAQRFFLDVLDGNSDYAPLGAPAGRKYERPRFRLISASKVPLAGSGLRNDLCHRLSLGSIVRVPTLEERRDDIPLLVQTFVRRLRSEQHLDVQVGLQALELLQRQPWPGNVRELEGVVWTVAERARSRRTLMKRKDAYIEARKTSLSLSLDEIQKALQSSPPEQVEYAAQPPTQVELSFELLSEHLEARALAFGGDVEVMTEMALPKLEAPVRKRPTDLTREDLVAALTRSGWGIERTAKQLGIAVNTLKSKMERLGIPRPSARGQR
ncbi:MULTISPECIES: sigma 54-interacting transcriptional regulator [Myxococcus]|uniref:sigma 54-dependent Fis family transcriptional regulator n=1 Tax=Myxococcus TaxID=32 RepID=UPI0011419D56|nr:MULTISPECIES: sigma 54-interacting transcriptional regulator [Myxococcus]NOK06239.1 sigma 54-interacting transcriptional regulator [Myxococcus xanthus]